MRCSTAATRKTIHRLSARFILSTSRGFAVLDAMPKGGGSDNASRVVMLTPSAGKQGVIDTVLACVREKACECRRPLVVGVGVGATFDKVGGLAKRALMRPLGIVNPDPDAAAFEAELLSAINATGIGAGALGGQTTALGVRVSTAPCRTLPHFPWP